MLALLVCLGLAGPVEPVRYRIDVKVRHGDPLGSREEGTVKHLADPALVTLSGCPIHFQTGGQVAVKLAGGKSALIPTGLTLNALPLAQPDGSVWLELHTILVSTGAEVGGVMSLTERQARCTRIAKPGETFKVRVRAESPTEQTWVEVTVTPSPFVEPSKPGAVPPELE